jgi:hypothetical protein
MNPSRRRQRGEGKIGCIVSFLILAVIVAIALKVVPIYWSDNELKDAATDLASRASSVPVEALTLQMKSKAKEIEIGEALAPGAIRVVKKGDLQQGTCVISLHYTRKVDLYGVYQWPVVVDTEISAPYLGGL